MKTAEDILYTKTPNREYPSYYNEYAILDAMEEYANQFKPVKVPTSNPPTHGKAILLYNKIGFVSLGVYSRSGKWININGCQVNDVVYWMDVPG